MFRDSEDFYTVDLNRLPQKVATAGYLGWNARFDAVMGFDDLAEGMEVYVAPAGGDGGHTGKGTVNSYSQFQISLPDGALGSTFKVRAVKRVAVVLSKGGETRKFCYNFSAIEKGVAVTDSSQPVVLDEFRTQLTAYACDSIANNGSGLQLPLAAPAVTPATAPVKIVATRQNKAKPKQTAAQ